MSNEQICYNYFKDIMKLNTAGACGILANIKYESNFKPNVYGDKGSSYGICQWHNTRFTDLKNYCNKNGYNYTTLDGQLHFLEYELNKSYKGVINYIRGVSNDSNGAYNAGYKWCYDFERPAKKAEASVKRGNYAKTYFNKYNGESSNTDIKDIQRTLNSRYNTELNVDGIYGSKTHKALVKGLQTELNNQYNAGLKVDGIFGSKTKSKCCTIKKGTRGNITWLVQAMLICKGYSVGSSGCDSICGNNTVTAIKNFQRNNKLTVDGICGKNTFEKLFK